MLKVLNNAEFLVIQIWKLELRAWIWIMGNLVLGFDVNHPRLKLLGCSPVLDRLSIVWEFRQVLSTPYVAPHHSLLNNYNYQNNLNILYLDLMSSIHLKLWRAWLLILDKLSIFGASMVSAAPILVPTHRSLFNKYHQNKIVGHFAIWGVWYLDLMSSFHPSSNFWELREQIDMLSVAWASASHWAYWNRDIYQGGNGTSTIENLWLAQDHAGHENESLICGHYKRPDLLGRCGFWLRTCHSYYSKWDPVSVVSPLKSSKLSSWELNCKADLREQV